MGIVIGILCLVLLYFFFLLNKEKEKANEIQQEFNQLKTEQDDEIRKRFEKEFEEEIKQKKEGIYGLEKQIKDLLFQISQKQQEEWQIQKLINEKQNFNNSLFKVREDELNRLIEEKRQEKELALNTLIEQEKQEKFLRLEQEQNEKISFYIKQFDEFLEGQEILKKEYLEEIEKAKAELNEFFEKRAAVNEAIRREKEIAEAEDFYRIVVPQEDQEDIETFNTIAPRLRNKEALNKLIYSVFIQRPLDEMIKRVTGGRDISGIYKITYLKTGEAYIGKTTNIKKRWSEHCKSALDIGTIAHSSFHNRLKKDGLWNYTFEILEEVSKEQLTEREKYYIQLYGTDTQLNMKVG